MRSVISIILKLRSKRTHDEAVEAVDSAIAGQRHEFNRALLARLEPHGRTRRNVQAKASCLVAFERERRVDFEEMKMRTDLHRPVTCIRYRHGYRLAARVEFVLTIIDEIFAGNHARLLLSEGRAVQGIG